MATVTGQQQIIKRLNAVLMAITRDTPRSLSSAAGILKGDAMINLNNRVGTGYWGIPWGRSQDGTSIRNPENWKITSIENNKTELRCISPHAAVVEVGGVTRISSRSGKPMPIGKQQGADPPYFYANSVRIQQGYHYLTAASTSPNTQKKMLNTMANIYRQSIAGVTI